MNSRKRNARSIDDIPHRRDLVMFAKVFVDIIRNDFIFLMDQCAA